MPQFAQRRSAVPDGHESCPTYWPRACACHRPRAGWSVSALKGRRPSRRPAPLPKLSSQALQGHRPVGQACCRPAEDLAAMGQAAVGVAILWVRSRTRSRMSAVWSGRWPAVGPAQYSPGALDGIARAIERTEPWPPCRGDRPDHPGTVQASLRFGCLRERKRNDPRLPAPQQPHPWPGQPFPGQMRHPDGEALRKAEIVPGSCDCAGNQIGAGTFGSCRTRQVS
jgi:hypothetical protein